MATRSEILDLSDDDKATVFYMLDIALNRTILFAFLQGIYTGMVAFTLSKIFSRGRGVGRNAMALVIIVLCILTAINFAFFWSSLVYSFIHHGQNFRTVYVALTNAPGMAKLFWMGPGISGCISTVVADSAMIWRCWIVWGRSWIIILLPLIFMFLGIAFKILQIRADIQPGTVPAVDPGNYTAIYVSFILATTLICTLLMVYRILSIEWAKAKLEGTRTHSFGAYRNVIEIIVESAALYSTVLIVDLVLLFQYEISANYLDPIVEFIRGVAPTLLVGRVASGHSRPDDSWNGSAISSLHFGSGQRTLTGTEMSTEDLMCSDAFVHDVEAQALAGELDEAGVNVCQRVEPETAITDKGVCPMASYSCLLSHS